MTRTMLWLLAVVALMGVASPPPADKFVGVWELESWERRHDDGRVTQPFGGDTVGRLMYTADGYMTAHIMQADRPPCTGASITTCTPEQARAAATGYLGYSGKFTVQENEKTVTHHPVVAFNPRRVGTEQVRYFEFLSENRLQLKAALDDGEAVLIWVRVAD